MKLTLTIPKIWNELTDKQLVKIALLMKTTTDKVFDTRCFLTLTSCKWYQLKKRAIRTFVLFNVPMRELRQDFDFIYSKNTRTIFPKINKLNGEQYYPPLPQIANLTIDEIAVADDLHIKYRNNGDVEYLYYLAATLYVTMQQPRPVFDKNDLTFKHEAFKKLSLGELLAIEITFAGCIENIAKKFPQVFPKSNKTTSKEKQPTTSGFPKLIRSLAGTKFGDLQKTKKTNGYEFLAEFNELIKQQKNAK